MKYLLFAIAGITAYLLCGINPAILLSKLIYKQDIRTLGSKNPGFTNFKRVFGWKFAWAVFLFDIFKAIVPALVFGWLIGHYYGLRTLGVAVTCFCGVLGHVFPVWYRFNGGKGFLTGIASVWLVDWRAGAAATVLFLLLLFTVKFMSLSSIVGVFSGACAMLVLRLCGLFPSWTAVVLSFLSAALIIYRHKANIVRLLHGEETKFSLFGHRKKSEEAAK